MKNLVIKHSDRVTRTADYATYLASIAVFKPLSVEEEVKLFEDIAKGDAKAKESIINHNLRFVVAVAKKYYYTRGGLSMLDLIQYGNIGLMDAVDTFDGLRLGDEWAFWTISYGHAHTESKALAFCWG